MYTIFDKNDNVLYSSTKQNDYIKKVLQLYKKKFGKSLFDTEPKIINDNVGEPFKCYTLYLKKHTIFIEI